jgi:phosphatidylethanolamine/phosphatidyl-N-methylethanolamine N-methyltransferase
MTDEGRAYWDGLAARYDRTMLLLGGPMPRMVELVADAVRGRECVLEIAAGTGLVTVGIAPVAGHVVATDYAPAMVERLAARTRELANVSTRVLDVYDCAEPDASYDAVVAANVLHLLPDLDAGLDVMLRVLRPGGRLVVPTYLHDATIVSRSLSAVMSAAGFPGRRRFTLERLVGVVEGRGMRNVRTEAIGGLLPIGFVAAEKP